MVEISKFSAPSGNSRKCMGKYLQYDKKCGHDKTMVFVSLRWEMCVSNSPRSSLTQRCYCPSIKGNYRIFYFYSVFFLFGRYHRKFDSAEYYQWNKNLVWNNHMTFITCYSEMPITMEYINQYFKMKIFILLNRRVLLNIVTSILNWKCLSCWISECY